MAGHIFHHRILWRPGFAKLLMAISEAFRERRDDVESEAGKLVEAIGHAEECSDVPAISHRAS